MWCGCGLDRSAWVSLGRGCLRPLVGPLLVLPHLLDVGGCYGERRELELETWEWEVDAVRRVQCAAYAGSGSREVAACWCGVVIRVALGWLRCTALPLFTCYPKTQRRCCTRNRAMVVIFIKLMCSVDACDAGCSFATTQPPPPPASACLLRIDTALPFSGALFCRQEVYSGSTQQVGSETNNTASYYKSTPHHALLTQAGHRSWVAAPH